MQLSELKLIVAANIIAFRTKAGLTQAELGAKLNYSDKTISKWERGEALPDAFVLTQLAELFSVTVDYLLSSHDGWEAPKEEPALGYSARRIIQVSVLGVWTLALAVFVAFWMAGLMLWDVFALALPISLLTLLVLLCVFGRKRHLQYVIAAFVLSVFVALFFLLPLDRPWQIFIVAVPAVAIAFLSCHIRTGP